jgi:hypothetical protein
METNNSERERDTCMPSRDALRLTVGMFQVLGFHSLILTEELQFACVAV